MNAQYDIAILGLSITSSWGNGHATTYRSLVRGLADRGHRILFLERDTPWYNGNRDEPHPYGPRTEIYEDFADLISRFEAEIRTARLVMVGSFVPDGVQVGEWVQAISTGVTAFYDIDTPVTLAKLADGSHEYVTPRQIARYSLYLSFTGGPVLRFIENQYGSPRARPLYCSVDPEQYRPIPCVHRWDLGYLGTYSDDRQPALEQLLLDPARQWKQGRFAVVGPMYPDSIRWPANVEREIHLSPREHPGFYGSQRFTLNITRTVMKRAGYSPSVRLFEAGACGVPVISDWWEGLDSILRPEQEVFLSSSCEETLRILRDTPETRRRVLGHAARRRMLAEHTPARRAEQLESYWKEADDDISAHTPRRNRRRRAEIGRVDARVPSEPARLPASRETRGAAGEGPISGDLHKPAGASR